MKKKKNRRYTQAERITILDSYDVSGMSLHDFCEKIGVNKRTVSNWVKARREQSGMFFAKSEPNQSFVSLPVNTHHTDSLPEFPSRRDEDQSNPLPQPIILRRDTWSVEIPLGSDRTDVYQILSALEDLYAV